MTSGTPSRVLSGEDLGRHLQVDRIELMAELEQSKTAAGRADLELLYRIRACDRAQLWHDDGCRSGAEWVAQRLGVSRWKARRWIDASHAIAKLPHIAAALERGALSADKVVELTRLATPENEADLVEWAVRVPPAAIRERADLEAQRKAKELEEIQRSRYLTCTPDHSQGIYWLEGVLPTDQGAIVAKALDRLADQIASRPMDEALTDDTSEEQWRAITADERRADALVEMASAQIAQDQDPSRATVVVHAPLTALAEDSGNGRLESGGGLHPEVIRKLSCDGRLRFVLTGEDGNAVGIGHTSQQIPHWLRAQVFDRDAYRCTFPGCEARRFLHPHHIVHWSRGGPTDLDNLLTLCTAHHTLVHESGWSVIRSPEGKITWFRPSGRIYEVGPAPPEPKDVHKPKPPPPRLIESRYASPLFLLADPGYRPSRKLPEWLEKTRPISVG